MAHERQLELLKDALSGLGPVSVRRMFGGAGVYADGVMFGLIADDTLYLKVDADTAGAYEAEGLDPFVYTGRGKTIALSYRRAPERLLDDADEMTQWARTALGVARRAAASKPRRAQSAAAVKRKSRSGR